MKSLQVVIDHMDDTLGEAHEYYRDYVMYKESEPKLAETALYMASTHLDLYDRWHSVVVDLINSYKEKNGDAPATMKEMWNYQHKKLTDEYDELKYKVQYAKSH